MLWATNYNVPEFVALQNDRWKNTSVTAPNTDKVVKISQEYLHEIEFERDLYNRNIVSNSLH